MPLDARLVGQKSLPLTQDVDARRTMAYAAALGDMSRVYFDTTADRPVLAHPLFPVCLEWPVRLEEPGRDLVALEPDEVKRGVHATHDLHLHRPIRAGERLTTEATLVAIERRRAGAYQVICFDTVSPDGLVVCSTYCGALLRDVDVFGEARAIEALPPTPEIATTTSPSTSFPIDVAAGASHLYSECSGIWHPNHTDLAIARGAALPGLILHGSATLALAVSALVNGVLDGAPERVRRVSCRFGALVSTPSALRVDVLGQAANRLRFRVANPDGSQAIRDGTLTWQ